YATEARKLFRDGRRPERDSRSPDARLLPAPTPTPSALVAAEICLRKDVDLTPRGHPRNAPRGLERKELTPAVTFLGRHVLLQLTQQLDGALVSSLSCAAQISNGHSHGRSCSVTVEVT